LEGLGWKVVHRRCVTNASSTSLAGARAVCSPQVAARYQTERSAFGENEASGGPGKDQEI
jgi:hypothetical protein